jgi:hypothetical protein
MAVIDICGAAVAVGGEVALCIAAAGHKGQHALRWEGDPRRIQHELATSYLDGLTEFRSRLAELLDQVDHTMAGIKSTLAL